MTEKQESRNANLTLKDSDVQTAVLLDVTIDLPLNRGEEFEIKDVGKFAAVRGVYRDVPLEDGLLPGLKMLWIRGQDEWRRTGEMPSYFTHDKTTNTLVMDVKERIIRKRVSRAVISAETKATNALAREVMNAVNAKDFKKAAELAAVDAVEWFNKKNA